MTAKLARALVAATLTLGLSATLAPARAAPAAASATKVAAVTKATTYRGSAKSYKLGTYDGRVVRWNPCASIHYRVNTKYAPSGALVDTKAAVARISAVTGMKFVYDGSTKQIPTTRSEPTADLVIAWAKPGKGTGRSDLLPGHGTVGVGGYNAAWYGEVTNLQIESGFVVLDTASNKFPSGFKDRKYGTRGTLLLHELGHSVGLEHVNDKKQLMYPRMADYGSYGAGDRAGLQKVGRKAGCIK